MAILLDERNRVIVQGITGTIGRFHTEEMIRYGTTLVGGVTPGRGGSTVFDRPVFHTVKDAVAATRADTSIVFVPPPFAADAIMEAADAGIRVIVAITEGIPVLDMVKVKAFLKDKPNSTLIGPNCPGVITPGECKIGIMPGYIHKAGKIGVVSRSGTLTYEAAHQLTMLGLGQSTAIGIGGDPVKGVDFVECLALFERDPQTQAVLMIGEIGGTSEEEAARFAKAWCRPPPAEKAWSARPSQTSIAAVIDAPHRAAAASCMPANAGVSPPAASPHWPASQEEARPGSAL